MSANVFDQVEKEANGTGTIQRASWTGMLHVNLPQLNLLDQTYHLRAGKSHGDITTLNVSKRRKAICPDCNGSGCIRCENTGKVAGKKVVGKEVVRFYRYRLGSNNERLDVQEVTYEEAKNKIRYLNGVGTEWFISAKAEKRFFLEESIESGKWEEIALSETSDFQENEDLTTEEVSPFERTKILEIEPSNFVDANRISEYKFKEIYMLSANPDKKVKEIPSRVRNLARLLIEKQTALVCFFSWGKIGLSGGYTYYTAVIYPYERKQDGKLWLLMGMSEGILQLDSNWAMLEVGIKEAMTVAPVPQARKPKVRLSF